MEYPPSYCDGVLYVNTFKGDTWAIDSETGKVIWRKVSHSPKPSTPAIAGDNVIVSSKDGTVTALTRSSGKLVWQLRTNAIVESSPADRRGRRVLRRDRRPAVRGGRGHGAHPLGVRHRRADQLEPVSRRRARLHHDVRRLDLLRPPERRQEALEHVREARRVPLRELLRERLDRRRAALHDRALGQDRDARRLDRADHLDGRRQLARLLDPRRRSRPDLRRRLQRRAARVPQDGRASCSGGRTSAGGSSARR